MNELKAYRNTWAEIDLNALGHNLGQLKKIIGSEVKILAAVKANAYGHGLVEVSRYFEKSGIDFLGTSSIDEAIALRKVSLKTRILNLSNLLISEIEPVIKFKIVPSVASIGSARALNKSAEMCGKKIAVHLKIDTGMGRIGVWHEEAGDFLKKIKPLNNVVVEGIYTHFPCAETDNEFTRGQLDNFNNVIAEVRRFGFKPLYLHAANSAGLLNYKEARFNLVRPGLALYGVKTGCVAGVDLKLKPALSFKTAVVYIKEVSAGRSVSYGRTFIAGETTRIATLPVGYADGYSQLFSNKAKVLIKGKFYPVAGRVCMDQTMVDIGMKDDIKVGDEVVLIGRQKDNSVRVEDLSGICDTIPYQVLCWIGSRVPRTYINHLSPRR